MNISPVSASASSQLLQRVFKQADSDASGGISSAELTSASGSGASSTDVTALFKSADSSSDGRISAPELKSAFDNMSTEMQSALISAQESATSAADTLKALAESTAANAGMAGMVSNGTPVQGEPPAQGAPPARPAGGGGGGGGGKTEEADPADANGDGVVTASEQAAYDSSQGAGSTTSTSTTTSATDQADATDSAKSATAALATKALATKTAYASLTA
ncbi:MAG: h [Xanthobacteraceae bacterium]|nr:h [Xanthobacteraceae bacterium]